MFAQLRDWLRERGLAGFAPPVPRASPAIHARHGEELRDVRRYLDVLETEVDALVGGRGCPPATGRDRDGEGP